MPNSQNNMEPTLSFLGSYLNMKLWRNNEKN